MAQSNWQRSMKNVSLSDNDNRGHSNRHSNRKWQIEINPSAHDKNMFKRFMQEELKYYNALVTAFAARTRVSPENILSIEGNFEKVYGIVAETQFMGIGSVKKSDREAIPNQLEKYRHIVVGTDTEKRKIPEHMAILFREIGLPAGLPTTVRKNMALEVLEFFKKQAKIHLQGAPKGFDEDVFRTSPETLDVMDDIRKRHLQLPKSCCNVIWDQSNEASKIYTPYSKNPIIIENIDFTSSDNPWNYLIIHQEPGSMPRPSTPWIIDIRSTKNLYLLKFLDVVNPKAGAAFHSAQRSSGR